MKRIVVCGETAHCLSQLMVLHAQRSISCGCHGSQARDRAYKIVSPTQAEMAASVRTRRYATIPSWAVLPCCGRAFVVSLPSIAGAFGLRLFPIPRSGPRPPHGVGKRGCCKRRVARRALSGRTLRPASFFPNENAPVGIHYNGVPEMRIAAMAAMLAVASGSTSFKPAQAGDYRGPGTSGSLSGREGIGPSGRGGGSLTSWQSRYNISWGTWGNGSLSPGSDGNSACICSGGGWGPGRGAEARGY